MRRKRKTPPSAALVQKLLREVAPRQVEQRQKRIDLRNEKLAYYRTAQLQNDRNIALAHQARVNQALFAAR